MPRATHTFHTRHDFTPELRGPEDWLRLRGSFDPHFPLRCVAVRVAREAADWPDDVDENSILPIQASERPPMKHDRDD